jgi:hypothetical protein
MPSNSEPTSAIELSTVYWHNKALKGDLALLDTTLKLPHVDEGLVALFGRRGRQEGFMAARDHALDRGMLYTVVDLKVALSSKPSGISRNEDNIHEQEILPVHNLTADYATDLSDRIRRDLRLPRYASGERNANSLLETLMLHPGATKKLLSYPEFDHIKVLVFQGTPSFTTEALPVAWIPPRHLGSIITAECRLDPDIKITLPTAMDAKPKVKPASTLTPVSTTTPRSRG